MKAHKKISQKKALELAIKTLIDWRRRHYAPGEEAFKKGIDLTFAITGHHHYTEYTQAIQHLEDMIEIITDPGVTVEKGEEG